MTQISLSMNSPWSRSIRIRSESTLNFLSNYVKLVGSSWRISCYTYGFSWLTVYTLQQCLPSLPHTRVTAFRAHFGCVSFMRVSAAILRGRPPGTQGHLSQLPGQIHAKAPRVGQKIGTNTPTPGATWATYSRCCLFLDAKVRVIMVYWSHISTKIHTSLYGVLKFELSGANFLGLRLFITLSLPIGKTLRMRTNRMKLKSRCRFP